jgi:hypothetical protein
MNLKNYPLLAFKYPNNKYGLYILKNGYTSTHSIFKQRINIREPKTELNSYNNKKVLLVPIRNPVDRFQSAINTFYSFKRDWDCSVDKLITRHQQNPFFNPHFFEVSPILKNAKLCFDQIFLYSFPNHFKQMLSDGGYNGNLPHENIGNKKVVLTAKQIEAVKNIYAEDIKIFESIKAPGQALDL